MGGSHENTVFVHMHIIAHKKIISRGTFTGSIGSHGHCPLDQRDNVTGIINPTATLLTGESIMKTLIVIGGGPTGITAALEAAALGAAVTLVSGTRRGPGQLA